MTMPTAQGARVPAELVGHVEHFKQATQTPVPEPAAQR